MQINICSPSFAGARFWVNRWRGPNGIGVGLGVIAISLWFGERGILLGDAGYYLQLDPEAPARINRGRWARFAEWVGLTSGALPNRSRPRS